MVRSIETVLSSAAVVGKAQYIKPSAAAGLQVSELMELMQTEIQRKGWFAELEMMEMEVMMIVERVMKGGWVVMVVD